MSPDNDTGVPVVVTQACCGNDSELAVGNEGPDPTLIGTLFTSQWCELGSQVNVSSPEASVSSFSAAGGISYKQMVFTEIPGWQQVLISLEEQGVCSPNECCEQV